LPNAGDLRNPAKTLVGHTGIGPVRESRNSLGIWLAALDDFRNWLIR